MKPWHWPFESRRLYTVHALKFALLAFVVAAVARFAVAGTLWITDDEAAFWALSREWHWSYAGSPPLAFWLARLSTLAFGDGLLGLRAPALIASIFATFAALRLVARLGWSKGADVTATLLLVTPALFFQGALAGPQILLVAFWLSLMETSFTIGAGLESGRRASIKLAMFSLLALLTDVHGALAVVASLAWLAATPRGRELLRAEKLLPLALGALVIVEGLLFLKGRDIDRHATTRWISEALLVGPFLTYGWVLLLKQSGRMKFLALWALAGAPSLALAALPVMIYFAKLSAATLRPRLLHAACVAGAAFTFGGVVTLFALDPGWKILGAHVEQLPGDAASLPLFGADARSEAMLKYIFKDDVRVRASFETLYPVAARGLASQNSIAVERPSAFLAIGPAKVAYQAPRNYECEAYSSIKSLRLDLCRSRPNERLFQAASAH